MENLFDVDRIHAKIDRWFDGGDCITTILVDWIHKNGDMQLLEK